MAKAMLIMDMPSSCNECRLHVVFGAKGIGVCTGTEGSKKRTYDNGKGAICPLRECPTKKENQYDNRVFEFGYNACIDEILGGGE